VRFEKLRELLMLLTEWALRQASTIIVIDEAHWIDSSSWALILSCVRKFSERYGLLIVTLSRVIMEHDESDTIKTLLELPQTSRILMPPLSNEQSISLVCESLEVDPKTLPSEIIKLIQRAQGVPIILRELIQMLKDSPNVSMYPWNDQKAMMTC
jgi:predicted ATPase